MVVVVVCVVVVVVVCECGYNFTFLCPSNFLKYSKSIRLHLSLLENIFYGGWMAVFEFDKYISISNGFGSALGNFASFYWTVIQPKPHMTKKYWQSVQLQNFNKQVWTPVFKKRKEFCECQWGPLWEYTSRLENRKTDKFPTIKAHTTGDGKIFIEPNSCCSATWKTYYSCSNMWSLIIFGYFY